VWTRAWVQPVLIRCGVMTHQARAMIRRRDSGQVTAAARTAITAAAMNRTAIAAAAAMNQPGPSVTPMATPPSRTPVISPSS
jgi:hypothetical protein